MPDKFTHRTDTKAIDRFMTMEEALDRIHAQKWFETDVNKVLNNALFSVQYLIWLKNRRFIISETTCFQEDGNAFGASIPTRINGEIYHMRYPIPKEEIRAVAELSKLGDEKR